MRKIIVLTGLALAMAWFFPYPLSSHATPQLLAISRSSRIAQPTIFSGLRDSTRPSSPLRTRGRTIHGSERRNTSSTWPTWCGRRGWAAHKRSWPTRNVTESDQVGIGRVASVTV